MVNPLLWWTGSDYLQSCCWLHAASSQKMFTMTDNLCRRCSIAVRISQPAPAAIFLGIFEQQAGFTKDGFGIGSHQTAGAGLHAFGALGGVPHHQHRFAYARG